MVFKIGDNDYSDKVVVDTYNVNKVDIYTEWEDANGRTHRDVYRRKIQGDFDMLIAKIGDYQSFIMDVQNHMTNGGYVPCKVCVNNMNEENVQADLFIDYSPIKTMNSNYTKGYLTFNVTVEER